MSITKPIFTFDDIDEDIAEQYSIIIKDVKYVREDVLVDRFYEEILKMSGNTRELYKWHTKKSRIIKMSRYTYMENKKRSKKTIPKRTILSICCCATIMGAAPFMFDIPYSFIVILPFSAPLITNLKYLWDYLKK